MSPEQRRIKRTRRGDYRLRLSAAEREVLRGLPAQVRELLHGDDPAARRLYPPAYEGDPEREAEYRRLMREELVASHRASLEVMEKTVDATRLDEEQLHAWMAALNDLRLVLGTRLDVTEDMYEDGVPPGDPRAPAFALYLYLGLLQEQVVAALAADLGEQR